MTKLENIAVATERRLATLEANYKALLDVVMEVKDNHLFHLKEDVGKLNEKIDNNNTKRSEDIQEVKLTMAKWGGIVVGAGAIIQLAINLMK